MSNVEQLVEMGFLKEKAEYALKINNDNVEQAMEWLLIHNNEDLPIEETKSSEIPSADAKSDESLKEESPSTSSEQEVKSIKCEDCGRLFRTQLEVEFHATKSGHLNFSESNEEKKALTEDEKKAQLSLLEEKIKAKRAEREIREKEEELEREKNRIKSGKDLGEVKRRMEEEEMKKIVEQRKREKQEEKMARERVKAQIESDKEARRAKAAGIEPQNIVPKVTSPPPVAVAVATPPKDYKETRIQIRLPNGSTIIETFNKQEQLAAVRLFVQMKQGEQPGGLPFGMMTTFPRKVFNEEDFEKSLEELQLVPSATIMVTKTS